MKITSAVFILLNAAPFAASASGVARFPTRDQLNDPSRGSWAVDTADVLKPRQLLYEVKEDGRYRVGYNLIREEEGEVKGYFVRLTIRNLSEHAVVAVDDVTLIDSDNLKIAATDRETFLALATTLSATKVPTSSLKRTAHSPSDAEDFERAYLRGVSEGRILKASEDVAIGRRMAQWAASFWLKPTIELPPHGAIDGVRVFLADPHHPLPLTIHVRVGESEFDFTSRAN